MQFENNKKDLSNKLSESDKVREASGSVLQKEAFSGMEALIKEQKTMLTESNPGKSSGIMSEFGKVAIIDEKSKHIEKPVEALKLDGIASSLDGVKKLDGKSQPADRKNELEENFRKLLSNLMHTSREYSHRDLGHGRWQTRLPDGTSIVIDSQGIVTANNPDGSWTSQNPDSHASKYRASSRETYSVSGTGETEGLIYDDFGDVEAITHRHAGISGEYQGNSVEASGFRITVNQDGTHSILALGEETPVRNPDGSIIHRDGGATVIERSDGIVETRLNGSGDIIYQYPSGQIVVRNADRSMTYQNTDGSIVTRKPDNTAVTQSADGQITTEYPDGSKVTQRLDGNRYKEYADGRTQLEVIAHPTRRPEFVEEHLSDGSSVKRYLTGDNEDRVETHYANGDNAVQNGPGYRSQFQHGFERSTVGGSSFATDVHDDFMHCQTRDASGRASYMDSPDFSVAFNADGTHVLQCHGDYSVRHQNGNTITSSADGQVVVTEFADGHVETRFFAHGSSETVTQFPDGRVVTRKLDGTEITQSPDGSVTTRTSDYLLTQRPDGTLVTTYNSDGRTVTQSPNGNRVITYRDGHTETVQLPNQ